MTEVNGKGCEAMPDLAEICSNCKAEYEQSIEELRQENERLKTENTELKNKPVQAELEPKPDGRDLLIDLVEEDILWQEAHLHGKGERLKKIVEAYRAIRPKKEG